MSLCIKLIYYKYMKKKSEIAKFNFKKLLATFRLYNHISFVWYNFVIRW